MDVILIQFPLKSFQGKDTLAQRFLTSKIQRCVSINIGFQFLNSKSGCKIIDIEKRFFSLVSKIFSILRLTTPHSPIYNVAINKQFV